MDEFLKGLSEDKTSQEAQEENRKKELKLVEENPPLVMPFHEFLKGDFDAGHRNLYIVWRDQQALFAGTSKFGIRQTWFSGFISHMHFEKKGAETPEEGQWVGDSLIGRVIVSNQPASMSWTIELRHVPASQDLRKEERKLITELHPLFNSTDTSSLTQEEQELRDKLIKAEQHDVSGSTCDL